MDCGRDGVISAETAEWILTIKNLGTEGMCVAEDVGAAPECWKKSIMLAIASRAGRPVEIDLCTKSMQRGAYAKVCVEIDLSMPLVPGLTVAIKGEKGTDFW